MLDRAARVCLQISSWTKLFPRFTPKTLEASVCSKTLSLISCRLTRYITLPFVYAWFYTNLDLKIILLRITVSGQPWLVICVTWNKPLTSNALRRRGLFGRRNRLPFFLLNLLVWDCRRLRCKGRTGFKSERCILLGAHPPFLGFCQRIQSLWVFLRVRNVIWTGLGFAFFLSRNSARFFRLPQLCRGIF